MPTLDADLQYNKALCLYKWSKFNEALEQVEIVLEGTSKLYQGTVLTDGPEGRGGSQRTCQIEALNLKAAILSKLGADWPDIKSCLDNLPMNDISLFDSVSLHNHALCGSLEDIHASIDKLRFLCTLPTRRGEIESNEADEDVVFHIPDETFVNLLMLYTCSGQNELGIKFLNDNRERLDKEVPEEILQFITIQLEHLVTMSDEAVYYRLDKLQNDMMHIAKNSNDDRFPELSVEEHNRLLLNIVTYQCSMLWEGAHYQLLERLLLRAKLTLGDSETWKKNLAHTIFMQDTRFEECVQLYESLLNSVDSDSLLRVDADVLSCLCVAYVLTGRNGDAETLIKSVEAEELDVIADDQHQSEIVGLYLNDASLNGENKVDLIEDQRNASHLCKINLHIGTLYCVKNNFKFGLMRMFKSLEPLRSNLDCESWFSVKRCILSLLDYHCKQMIWANDDILKLVSSFLAQCEKHGLQVEARKSDCLISGANGSAIDVNCLDLFHGRNSITYEARLLRSIVLTLIHD